MLRAESRMEVDPVTITVESKLSGPLGERHKILNEMVRKSDEDGLSKEIINNISAAKRVDLIFLARLANHTKNASLLCQLLKSQDGIVVSVAMHSKWFFTAKTHPEYVNIDYFVKEIFPHASYHTVCRIVSNLSAFLQDESVAEDFYNYIYDLYGRKLALKLLPKCSNTFIHSQIMRSNFQIPCTQLFSIFKKNKKLSLEYLQGYFGTKNTSEIQSNKYNLILKKMAEDDSEMFISFIKQYHNKISRFSLGQKITKNIMKRYSDEIIANHEKFRCLDKKTLLSSLKGEKLENFLLSTLPKEQECFNQYNMNFNYFKPQFRFKMLTKLYSLKYNGAQLIENDKFVHFNLCHLLSADDRISWAKKRIEQIKPNDRLKEDFYWKYLNVTESIPRIQTLCKATNEWSQRSDYLKQMVECCQENNNKDALLQVLKYVSNRHRNDAPILRHSFLNKISSSFILHELSAEHWLLLNEIIEFLCVKKEIEKKCWNDLVILYCNEYIKYCLNHNIHFETYLDKIILYQINGVAKSIQVLDPKVLNVIFDKYKAKILEKHSSNLAEDINSSVNIIMDLINLLSKCKDVFEYPWLFDYLKENYNKWSEAHKEKLFIQIKKDKKLQETYSKEIYKYAFDEKLAVSCIKHKPEIILDQLEIFVNKSVVAFPRKSKYNRIYGKINTYLMDSLGNDIMEILKANKIENFTDDNIKEFAIGIIFLSYLIPSNESQIIIEKYSPKNFKVNLECDKKTFGIGEVFGKYMGTINPPVKYSTLMCYTGGDYFKYSLRSLLTLVHKKPTDETRRFIYELLTKPISIKKHSIRLASSLCPRSELLAFYKTQWNSEKNPSMRKVIYEATNNLLKSEENLDKHSEIWLSLKYFISSFTESDKDLFVHLTKTKNVMPHIINDYFQTWWNTLKRLSTEKVDVNDHIIKLMRSLSDFIDMLSEQFCETIITEYFVAICNPDNKFYKSKEIIILLANYLVKTKSLDIQTEHFLSISKILKNYIASNWNVKTDFTYGHREIIKDFILTVCRQSMKARLELNPINLLNKVAELLKSALSSSAVLELIIILDLTVIYKELLLEPNYVDFHLKDPTAPLASEVVKTFGQKIAMYLNKLCAEYGNNIERILVCSYNDFDSVFFNNEQKNELELHLIDGLIENANNQCLLMAIDLLPTSLPYDEMKKNHCFGIIDKIKYTGDQTINIILNNKIKLDQN